MQRINKSILLGFILIESLLVKSQDAITTNDTLKISLEDVWAKADVNSRMVRIKKENVKIKAEEVQDLQLERLPELGVMGNAEKATNIPIYTNGLFNKPEQHEVIHTLYRVGADFHLNIYNGNKLNLKIEESKLLFQISLIEKDEAVSNIRYKATALYLELQRSFIFKQVITRDIEDQEKQLVEIKAFLKNGLVLKSDVLRIELDLSKRKMALVVIDNDILITSQKLNILMGEPDERILSPSSPLIDSEINSGTYSTYLNQAFKHSFPYHISEHRTQLSKLNIRQIKANTRPKVGLNGDFYYANPQIFLFPYNPYWYSLGIAGVRASFPISSLYHNIHKLKAARIEFEKEEELHKDVEDKLRQQVNEAYLRYKEALIQIEVAKVNVQQAIENERIIKNTYFKQTSLITDLLDADIQLLQTKFELATAQITAQTRYYLLQNIIGVL